MSTRNEKIIEALKGLKVATWSEIKKKIGEKGDRISDATLSRGLKSLQKSGEVLKEGRWYALPQNRKALQVHAEKEREGKMSSELRKLEEYFEKHPYWQHEILDDTIIKVICNDLGLNPRSEHDVGLIYKAHSKYKRKPAIF